MGKNNGPNSAKTTSPKNVTMTLKGRRNTNKKSSQITDETITITKTNGETLEKTLAKPRTLASKHIKLILSDDESINPIDDMLTTKKVSS